MRHRANRHRAGRRAAGGAERGARYGRRRAGDGVPVPAGGRLRGGRLDRGVRGVPDDPGSAL